MGDLYFSKEHPWITIDNPTGTVGITKVAQSERGEIVYVDLPKTGDDFKQDEVFGAVEALKTISDLFMPLSGEATFNEKLLESLALINKDSFGEA